MALRRINRDFSERVLNMLKSDYEKMITTPVPEFDKGFGYQGAVLFSFGGRAEWHPYYSLPEGEGFGPSYTSKSPQEKAHLVEIGRVDKEGNTTFVDFDTYNKRWAESRMKLTDFYIDLISRLDKLIVERDEFIYRERPFYNENNKMGCIQFYLAHTLPNSEEIPKTKIYFSFSECKKQPGHFCVSKVKVDFPSGLLSPYFSMQQRRNLFDFVQEKILLEQNRDSTSKVFSSIVKVSESAIDTMFPNTKRQVGTIGQKVGVKVRQMKEERRKKNEFHW